MEKDKQFIIRISDRSLSFAMNSEDGILFEPYEFRSGISVAANLREAFRNDNLLRRSEMKVTVLLDSPTLLVPLEDFTEDDIESQYRYVYPSAGNADIETCVLPSFKNVAAMAVEKDLKTVLHDHFEEVRIYPLMASVWEFFLRRSAGSNNKKLYAYFHDGKMDLCSFNRNRFGFCNSFEVQDNHDALYFILGVWKQIGGSIMTDDLFLAGRIPSREAFIDDARHFLRRVYHINPSADFNRAPATQVLGMPFDMMLRFLA